MRLVIIESPYAGNVPRNVAYARACVKDALRRGEAPIASHLLYTQEGILDDTVPAERELGIEAGLAWQLKADAVVMYLDLGLSKGMWHGVVEAIARGVKVECRMLMEDCWQREETDAD